MGLWLLTAGIAATLVLTGSRGALMALAVSTGVLTLTWLLKANVRQRFPALLRPLLNPRVLIAGSAVAGLLMIAGVLLLTLNSPLRSGDTNRLDMWRSALDMTADRPILGVGPHQFGTALRLYGDPVLEQSQTRMSTAHNVFLNTLAEGGIVGFGVAIWLGITFARVWWRQWQSAYPARRRRLEGIISVQRHGDRGALRHAVDQDGGGKLGVTGLGHAADIEEGVARVLGLHQGHVRRQVDEVLRPLDAGVGDAGFGKRSHRYRHVLQAL